MSVELSIILPCYNESKHLYGLTKEIVKDLENEEVNFEIIMVDDGSEDETLAVIRRLREDFPSHIDFISNDRNRGLGFSYKKSLARASGEYITWIPSDGEVPIETVLSSYRYRAKHRVVLSYPNDGVKNRKSLRRALSRIYIYSLNTLLNLNLKYYNGNALYYKEDVKNLDIKSNRFGFNSELLVNALKVSKVEVLEVPFTLKKRASGKSSALTFISLLDVLSVLVRTLLLVARNTQ